MNDTESGRPLMCVAADYGNTSVIELLIQKGANVNVSPVTLTCDLDL